MRGCDYLTLITSTQFPHSVQTRPVRMPWARARQHPRHLARCGRRLRLQGPACAARKSRSAGWRRRSIIRCAGSRTAASISRANANCREHHYRDHRLCRRRTASCWQSTASATSMPARIPPIRFPRRPRRRRSPTCCQGLTSSPLPLPLRRGRHQQVPDHPLSRRRAHRASAWRSKRSWMRIAREAGIEPYEARLRNMVRPEQMPFDNVVGKHFDSGDHPECLRRAVEAIRLPEIASGKSSRSRTAG